MAHYVNKKIAQGCQSGTRRILAVCTLYYHFQQKIAYIPNLTVPLCFYSTRYSGVHTSQNSPAQKNLRRLVRVLYQLDSRQRPLEMFWALRSLFEAQLTVLQLLLTTGGSDPSITQLQNIVEQLTTVVHTQKQSLII